MRILLERQRKRTEIGVPWDATLLISVGELNRNKNHSVIIKALARVKDSNIHYVIAGQGVLEKELNALAGELHIDEQVHFIGFRTDIPKLYCAADICVFPSIREGLGLAAIEGMASGLPLIVSDNRGTRGFLTANMAITCKYDDIDGFARAILKLAGNLRMRKRMGETNRKKSTEFDVSVVETEMAKIYGELIDFIRVRGG